MAQGVDSADLGRVPDAGAFKGPLEDLVGPVLGYGKHTISGLNLPAVVELRDTVPDLAIGLCRGALWHHNLTCNNITDFL